MVSTTTAPALVVRVASSAMDSSASKGGASPGFRERRAPLPVISSAMRRARSAAVPVGGMFYVGNRPVNTPSFGVGDRRARYRMRPGGDRAGSGVSGAGMERLGYNDGRD